MSGREQDIPLIEPAADIDAAMTEQAGAFEEFAALMAAEEAAKEASAIKSNVLKLPLPDLKPRHTDEELVPESPVDALYSRMCFDPEAQLLAAASESWLLDDLVPARGIGFIYGPPGSYKSFMAVDMAMSVATGQPWHGYECEMPGAVVYIAAEGSRGLMERVTAWRRKYGQHGLIAIMAAPVMMDDAVMVQAFTECLERAREVMQAPIRLVVVDTMARSFSGDENSAQEVGAFVNACQRFSSDADDCFVMVVAHTGKDITRGIRGSSAIDGAADCHFLVTRPNIGQALVKNTKQKDIEMAEPMRFAMDVVDIGIVDRKGRPRKSLVPVLESKGADADPDAEEEEVTAFDHRDSTFLVGLVRAADVEGRKVTEDDLRKEFMEEMASSGKKEAAAKKAWQRTFKRVREEGRIMKAGAHIYLGNKL